MIIIGPDKPKMNTKNVNILLFTSLFGCLGCSKQPSHLDSSVEYQQHIFWLRYKKINSNYIISSKGLIALQQCIFEQVEVIMPACYVQGVFAL